MGEIADLVKELRLAQKGLPPIVGPKFRSVLILANRAATALEHAAAREAKLETALALWLKYDNLDEADFTQHGPMLVYADAIAATRALLTGGK